LYLGELNPGEDKAHDTPDDGQRVGAVHVPGERSATPAGGQGERGAVGALSSQHRERTSAVGRHRARVPERDADWRTATTGTTERQIGNSSGNGISFRARP